MMLIEYDVGVEVRFVREELPNGGQIKNAKRNESRGFNTNAENDNSVRVTEFSVAPGKNGDQTKNSVAESGRFLQDVPIVFSYPHQVSTQPKVQTSIFRLR